MKYEFHEAAEIFPLDEGHLDSLAEDIKRNGQIVPIELMDGKILDGRRRWLACERANVKPITTAVNVPDPISYVLSLNKERRHLSTQQLGIVAGKADKLYAKYKNEAEEQQSDAGKHGKKGGRGKKKTLEELSPQGFVTRAPQSRDKLGEQFGVSGRTAERGRNVVKKGIPELEKAVWNHKLPLNEAEKISKLPTDEQPEALNRAVETRANVQQKKKGSVARDTSAEADTTPEPSPKRNGKPPVGVILANEALNALMKIPKDDPLRKRGFQIVTDWIKANP